MGFPRARNKRDPLLSVLHRFPMAFQVKLRRALALLAFSLGAAALHAQSIPGYDPAAPVFVKVDEANAIPARATLPEPGKPGEFPRLIFTPAELSRFRDRLNESAPGKAALATLCSMAKNGLGEPIVFPSIEDTVANLANRLHEKLSNRAQILAFAYALDGDRACALKAREILLGYAERYAAYPRHAGRNKSDSSKVFFQRLSEAMWLIPLIEACDYLYAGDVLSADDKRLIETKLIRPAILEIRRSTSVDEIAQRARSHPDWRTFTPPPASRGTYSNWVNFYSAATLLAGALLDDRDLVDLAAADFREAIATGIGDDGMWGEGAIGYQLFAMNAITTGFEAAAHQGLDLWNVCDGRFKQLFDSPLRYAYPDGTLPGVNDSGRAELGTWQTMVYDYGYLRYRDPAYATIINRSPRQLFDSESIYTPAQFFAPLTIPAVPAVGSALFRSLGYGILRDPSKYALLDYGPHGGTHGHFDKLNLILFGSAPGSVGDELGGEPVMHGYADPLHAEWTRQTIAHNTMAVDGESQAATEGKLLIFADTPRFKAMRAESVESYPGVWLDRTVITTPDLVIDLYLGRSLTAHTWDRTFRYAGKLSALAGATGEPAPLGTHAGYQHLKAFAPNPATGTWRGEWTMKAGIFQAVVAGAPAQQIILARGPDQEDVALARQQGTAASFAAVYRLTAWPNAVGSIRWIAPGDADQPAVLEVTQENGIRTLVIIAHAAGPWTAAGWTSDARVLCVQQQNEKIDGLLAGGTFARQEKFDFHQDTAGIYPLGK
ncbi:MAG: Heparinase family protein [Verrucomicrobia bacterium]|nr:Heparinase family protein [Verrucomicrobiota bacterium]